MAVVTAMLLQHEADLGVTEEELKIQLLEDWPGFDVSQLDCTELHGGTLTFTYEDYVVLVSLIQRPMLELNHINELCAASRLWPDEVAFDTSYQAYTLVSVAGEGPGGELGGAVLLTRLVASLIAIAPHGFAVFWESAQHLAYPGFVREIALQELPRPLPAIWVSYNIGPGPSGKIAALTVGLERLGLMDVEIPEVDEPGRQTLELLMSMAGYLMDNGLVIKDGDTITDLDASTIHAVYGPSMLTPSKTVIQLQKHPAP